MYQVNWQQTRKMTGYKKSISVRHSPLEGVQKFTNLQKIYIYKYHNKAAQCKITKTLNVSQSTLHDMKRFHESGEIAVSKSQG